MELAQALTLDSGCLLARRPVEVSLEDGGQVLELTLRLRGVLPERRIAVAVTLDERDEDGCAYPRGLRVFALPAWHGHGSRDLEVPPIRFVLPASLSASSGGPRQLTVRVDAHYIDRGEVCPLSK